MHCSGDVANTPLFKCKLLWSLLYMPPPQKQVSKTYMAWVIHASVYVCVCGMIFLRDNYNTSDWNSTKLLPPVHIGARMNRLDPDFGSKRLSSRSQYDQIIVITSVHKWRLNRRRCGVELCLVLLSDAIVTKTQSEIYCQPFCLCLTDRCSGGIYIFRSSLHVCPSSCVQKCFCL